MALETNKGIMHADDIGTIENPVQNGTLALQTSSAGSKSAGQLYLYTANGWVDYLTGRTIAAATITALTAPTLTSTTLTETTLLTNGAAGSATSAKRILFKKTGLADNTATDVLTVTVPNSNQSAAIKLLLLAANGSTDAFESSRVAEGLIVLARTTGANVVAGAASLELTQIATVAGGATNLLSYGTSAIVGAVGAVNTFTVTVTVNDSGNAGSNQVVVLAEVINAEASGVTIAAA